MANPEDEALEPDRRSFMRGVLGTSLAGAAAVALSAKDAVAQPEIPDFAVVDGVVPRFAKASVQLTFSGTPSLKEIQIELQRVFERYKCLRCGFGGFDLGIAVNPPPYKELEAVVNIAGIQR